MTTIKGNVNKKYPSDENKPDVIFLDGGKQRYATFDKTVLKEVNEGDYVELDYNEKVENKDGKEYHNYYINKIISHIPNSTNVTEDQQAKLTGQIANQVVIKAVGAEIWKQQAPQTEEEIELLLHRLVRFCITGQWQD